MSTTKDPDQQALAVAHAHAAAEGSGDLNTTLATLSDDPVYEFQPVGRVFRGKDTARRYYEHFFAHFSPLTERFEIRGEWTTPEGLGQEYTLWLRLPDGRCGQAQVDDRTYTRNRIRLMALDTGFT